jgi:hypothetical protein
MESERKEKWFYCHSDYTVLELVTEFVGISELVKTSNLNSLADLFTLLIIVDRLCGLLVRVPGYRSRGPGSIPSAIRLSEK